MKIPQIYLVATMLMAMCFSCTESDEGSIEEEIKEDDDTTLTDPGTAVDISTVVSKFYNTNGMSVTVNDETIVITSKNQPDHVSMYWDQSNALYEAYSEPDNSDFKKNPNSIEEQNFVYTIPRYAQVASTHEATNLGAMGVSINGVAFFNQQAAPGDDILDELNTFDQYEGHPTGTGAYHYHIEPVYLTETKGDDAFLGVLLDGFPVYGPVEDGVTLTNSDLDDYHGHYGVTADFPNGIYHYHITAELPWINGDGFYGTPGSWTP